LFDWFYRIITKKKHKKTRKRFCNLYLWELGTKLIDEKREEEKVNVYEIKFQSIYRERNSKEIALSLLFFILMRTAYIREEIT
jgi:hypothetical protein